MTDTLGFNPNQIVSPGTQVVSRVRVTVIGGGDTAPAGAVAEVLQAPVDAVHAYRVRFVDGREAMLRRSQFGVRKVEQRGHMGPWGEGTACGAHVLDDHALREHVIYRCVIGSRAYGLDTDASDVDRRGIYLPPADMHWSLCGIPEQLESKETEECYWELQKFLMLALKANPNVLECLYTPEVEHASALAEELLDMREVFLSKLVYQTYNGYVMSQFKKLTARLDAGKPMKWKHAMHLIRLLLAGIRTLRDGYVPVRVEEHRERLLEIRGGETPWEKVDAWRLDLHREFDAAFEGTRLPDRPDYVRANGLLIRARRMSALQVGRHVAGGATTSGTCLKSAGCRTSGHREPTQQDGGPDGLGGGYNAFEQLRRHSGVLDAIIGEQPYPLLFVTVSGAHLYGFSSPDSDFDLRGIHVLPLTDVVGLAEAEETVEKSSEPAGLELDLVTHDLAKFFRLMLKRNGYVLEQLYSPLILQTTPEHAELKAIGAACITRNHAHHYLGFARRQWALFEKDQRVKPLLYVYRALLTGVHLMRTGEIEANLRTLNGIYEQPGVAELIDRKTHGAENMLVEGGERDFHVDAYGRLTRLLEEAYEACRLPDRASGGAALNDLLLRVRLAGR